MYINARQLALHDIKVELESQNKCFIAFRVDLNPVMREMVEEYIKQQNKLK